MRGNWFLRMAREAEQGERDLYPLTLIDFWGDDQVLFPSSPDGPSERITKQISIYFNPPPPPPNKLNCFACIIFPVHGAELHCSALKTGSLGTLSKNPHLY